MPDREVMRWKHYHEEKEQRATRKFAKRKLDAAEIVVLMPPEVVLIAETVALPMLLPRIEIPQARRHPLRVHVVVE